MAILAAAALPGTVTLFAGNHNLEFDLAGRGHFVGLLDHFGVVV
jgi:hypothetical protein